MPYIKKRERPLYDEALAPVIFLFGDKFADWEAGELNYALTRIVDAALNCTPPNYNAINEIIGVLECMKLELYRRVAAPYENAKKRANGDVYQ
jgi:hypothetical protein